MRVLVLGCGYVGSAFAGTMTAQGARVQGTCRRAASAEALGQAGIAPILFDGTASAELVEAARRATHILASIPPGPDGDPALLALSKAWVPTPSSWIGYLSTTGVYGDRAGGWAFEADALTPMSIEAKRRAEAEAAWRALASPAHVFRLPGIYGPGRSALEQVLSGSARRIDKPGQVFSRAHRTDIVAALCASIANPNPGRIYNICDDHPCASGEVIVEACKLLGREPPPLIPFEAAGLSEMGKRFYSECKRVSNARAKEELGWKLAFPTYVEGLGDCYADLQARQAT
jgi:nucleoside-diphosphate-sugar epimerase